MNKLSLLVGACLTMLSAFSQDLNDFKGKDGRVNDYSIVEYNLEHNYPGYKAYADAWHKQVASQVNESADRASGQLLRIYVVVHIVWKEQAENIAQFNIEEQIRILNECYQRKNADTSSMRAVFNPIAGSPNIEFVLAAVNRVQTNTTFSIDFFGPDIYGAIKRTNQGGSDGWNPANYLNIWVGNLSDNFLAGYAYPPSDAVPGWQGSGVPSDPTIQGLVIDYRAFGPFTSFQGLNLRGKTTVHEVGHYLGLRHIWGDGDCSEDDNIADTPIAFEESSFDCDKNKNTCNQGAGDLPDMVENYMDYSSDNCQNTFTKGQADFMRTVLQTYRPGLLTTTASISEIEKSTIQLYPNPSTGVFTLQTNDKINQIEVMDLSGKVVFKQAFTSNTLNLEHLQNGSYVLLVQTDAGKQVNRISLQK